MGKRFVEEFATLIDAEGKEHKAAPAANAKDEATPAAASETKTSAKKKSPKEPRPPKEKKVSALDAAAKVLGEQAKPMTCPEMIEEMSRKKYWTSPNGATPHATLYAAILREITTKGKEARFEKAGRGQFALARVEE